MVFTLTEIMITDQSPLSLFADPIKVVFHENVCSTPDSKLSVKVLPTILTFRPSIRLSME